MMKAGLKNKKGIFAFQTFGSFLAFLALFVFSVCSNSHFFTVNNIGNVLGQCSYNGMLAIGMTFVILTGGIDLSVGSVIAVSGVVLAKCSGIHPVFAIGAAIGVGLLIGWLNGFLVATMKIPAFVATLATQMAARGGAHLLVGATSVVVSDETQVFRMIGRGKVFGCIPWPSIIMFIGFLGAYLFLRYLPQGRDIYSVGGNEEAASMMGLKCGNVKIMVYMISGCTAAIAGIILASRLRSVSPLVGTGYELQAISTVVLGGTLLTGGRGKISGTFWAALTMGLITNMFNMQANISTWIENILMGILLLGITLLQTQTFRNLFVKIKTADKEKKYAN